MENQFGFGVRARNVNEALAIGMQLVKNEGVFTSSRGLEVMRAPGPVTTVYERPMERVLFCPHRDANPFFHLLESMWIIGGSNRVELPAHYLPRYAQFSDDGMHLHGAYGYRLRHAYQFDQIEMACAMLSEKPDSRQVVMSIWHPTLDLATKTADMPCNDMLMMDIVDGALNMTVCNRSNDVIWGAYGANAVQFSFLLEYMAASVGVRVGRYTQQSNNYHIYLNNSYWLKFNEEDIPPPIDHYDQVQPYSMAQSPADARAVFHDCVALCRHFEDGGDPDRFEQVGSLFFKEVVVPVMKAHVHHKAKRAAHALKETSSIVAEDWRLACREWLLRRQEQAA